MMDYDAWELEVPEVLKQDALWRMRVYRLALFVASGLAGRDTACAGSAHHLGFRPVEPRPRRDLVPTSPKGTREARDGIEPGSMNTLWDRPAREGIGTSKEDMFWGRK